MTESPSIEVFRHIIFLLVAMLIGQTVDFVFKQCKENICILYNQRDATYTMFFIIISALHVSGSISVHHQELIKLYVQPWVLSCFPAVYCW